jgi:hypothetical protein
LHFSYEKAGLTLRTGPIPWNAEAVTVEAMVRVPSLTAEVRSQFRLHMPGRASLDPEALRPTDVNGQARVFFRLAVPRKSLLVELRYGDRSLGQLLLPVLSQDEFSKTLEVTEPTVHVRLGDETHGCRSYVTTQAKELYASALLTSPTCLAPLADLIVGVEIVERSGRASQTREIHLSGAQLSGRQALVMSPIRRPRGSGASAVRWLVAGEARAEVRLVGLTPLLFRRSLRLSATRFLLEGSDGPLPLARIAPASLDEIERLGPVFVVTSSAEGMAATAEFAVRAVNRAGATLLEMPAQRVSWSDGPAVVAPGTLARADLEDVYALEIRHGTHRLGGLSLTPVPAAAFDSEGGFASADTEFAWSPSADEQLQERLGKLLGG